MTNKKNDGSMLCALDAPLAASVERCGGKSAGLHKLLSAGLPVPPGFVVTTAAFEQVISQDAEFRRALAHLDECPEGPALRDGAAAVREAILSIALPHVLANRVVNAWTEMLGRAPVAVRSSATTEDLADASFAGQQDTFLSIDTEEGLLKALRASWASLFTERAVVYRRSHGYDSGRVALAVVVQRMVQADAAGVIFTADPLSGRRGHCVIEAVRGLGEALVSGHTTPERYRVRTTDGAVLERIGPDGAPLDPTNALLSDAMLMELRDFGMRAQAYTDEPVDMEWALSEGRMWLVQARPITTLWPLPEGEPSPGWRVFVSFGHLQVNTAALSRVGTSMMRRMFPLDRDPQTGLSRLVRVSGDRLYIDATPLMATKPFGKLFPKLAAAASEPIAARLVAASEREELHRLPAGERMSTLKLARSAVPVLARAVRTMLGDPRKERDAYLQELYGPLLEQGKKVDEAVSLAAKLDVLFEELGDQAGWVFRAMFPRMLPVLLSDKLLGKLAPWLCPGTDYRTLLQGLDGNVTTEMDLALADLADLSRDEPSLAQALMSDDPKGALDALRPDSRYARFFRAWDAFVDRFGQRSAGEIDPAVPRFREDPRIPLRSVAGSLERPRGALRQQHAKLARRALSYRDELIDSARKKPLGALLAPLTAAFLTQIRMLQGIREEHKFVLVKTIDLLRNLVLEAGALLAQRGVLASESDIWFLELHEIRDAVRDIESGKLPNVRALVEERRALRERFENVSPPAVLTSEGESLSFVASGNAPDNSLVGTAVSGGVYEGLARVVHDPATEKLAAGEILVARFTDPGWTPLFGHAGALVMEVGGQMTHGSVIAREIGIPAVVAVEGATAKLRSGDRVRVDGERGWVTVLEGGAA